ncbi:MAG TPA: cytochrome d ubiquinol oxidase subunit II [Pseudonocardiaceae bacterium]
MELLWYCLLGLLLTGYFALAGLDYGVGALLRVVGTDEHRRRMVLGAIGPFFLGNEVWLVAAVGVLFGAFPLAEGELLSGTYPVMVAVLLGAVTVVAAVPLRSRNIHARRRTAWDTVIGLASVVTALGWGVLLGNLLQGLPLDARGHLVPGGVAHLFDPYALLFGATVLALFLLHGATFLALRLPGDLGNEARRRARTLVLPAAVLPAVTAGWGALSDQVRASVNQPVPALLGAALVVLAVLGAGHALATGRPGWALAGTAVAAALPVPVVGAALYPTMLPSSLPDGAPLTVSEAVAAPETLGLLGGFAVLVLPVVLLFQWMTWWVFRGRVDQRTPLYF